MSGLDSSESFIATTGNNETNIISCLLAKHLMNKDNRKSQGCMGKTVALVNKEDNIYLIKITYILLSMKVYQFLRQQVQV